MVAPAWRLSVTELDDGSGMVSLLVSHASRTPDPDHSCLEAVTGAEPGPEYRSDSQGYLRKLGADTVAAAAGLGRAAKAAVTLVPVYSRVRKTLAAARRPPPAYLITHDRRPGTPCHRLRSVRARAVARRRQGPWRHAHHYSCGGDGRPGYSIWAGCVRMAECRSRCPRQSATGDNDQR